MQDLATLTGKPASDARLALALRRASNRFYGDTHRDSILISSTQESYNGDGSPTLLLRGAPVSRVGGVLVNGIPLAEGQDYEVDARAGILARKDGVFPQGLGNVLVDYTHGHAEIPGDVEDAVLEHAATIAEVMIHIQQETGGSTGASYAKEATVGTTAKWVETVARYDLDTRA